MSNNFSISENSQTQQEITQPDTEKTNENSVVLTEDNEVSQKNILDLPRDIYDILVKILTTLSILNLYDTSKGMREIIEIAMKSRDPIIMSIKTKADMEKYSSHPLINLSIRTNKFSLCDIIPYIDKIRILNMSGNRMIFESFMFKRISILNLSGTCIRDTSKLGKVDNLDLSYTAVTDVSTLGNVHTLNLSWTKVEDVSNLGKVFNLNLSCTKVTDVSDLGSVNTLNISWCSIGNISSLLNVKLLINKNNKRFWSI
jgi:hypothetical protein